MKVLLKDTCELCQQTKFSFLPFSFISFLDLSSGQKLVQWLNVSISNSPFQGPYLYQGNQYLKKREISLGDDHPSWEILFLL